MRSRRLLIAFGVTWAAGGGCLDAAAQSSPCAAPSGPAMSLQVGQRVSRSVDARNDRNHTGVVVDSGAVYRFLASGKWRDGQLDSTTAGGFSLAEIPVWWRPFMWAGQPLRRARHARWFALIGEISPRGRFFVIGDSLPRWQADRRGELVVFANDVKHFTKNNQGCITLSIERLR